MTAQPTHWWSDRSTLKRFVCDLLAGELATLRPGRETPPLPWLDDVPLGENGLGADSLDRLKLSTAFAEAIHLQRGTVDDGLLARPSVGGWVDVAAAGLGHFSAELTFRTSGSSGRPKWCVHELADLLAEVDILAERFAGSRRILAAVPSHHIYGFLFTILVPGRLGVDVVDVRGSSPVTLAGKIEPGDVVIGHPDFWRAFARGGRVAAGAIGVTSTAPCPADVARAVTANGVDMLVEVYGSSETAGIGWRHDPLAAYELFSYWRRGRSDEELIRLTSDGEQRRVSAPDRLVWDDERRFRPAGRLESAVQVGGQNVFPNRVRDVLCRHPGVAAAAVRLMRPDEGERLKAFIVPRPESGDLGALRAELWTWIDERLAVPERPKSIAFGAALPVGALGKSADWPIDAADPP